MCTGYVSQWVFMQSNRPKHTNELKPFTLLSYSVVQWLAKVSFCWWTSFKMHKCPINLPSNSNSLMGNISMWVYGLKYEILPMSSQISQWIWPSGNELYATQSSAIIFILSQAVWHAHGAGAVFHGLWLCFQQVISSRPAHHAHTSLNSWTSPRSWD